MIISVQNQKGGVGKTTLSIHISHGLVLKGYKTLLVDADPQGSSRDWAATRGAEPPFPVIGLDRPTIHRDLPTVAQGYDHVIIDGPPRVTDLARSAVIASDLVVIPIQPSPYDIWASDEIIKIIQEASIFKEKLKSVFVINRKITNTAIGRDVAESLSEYPYPVLTAAIHQRVIFAESAATGNTVFDTASTGVAAKEVMNVVNELLSRGNDGNQ